MTLLEAHGLSVRHGDLPVIAGIRFAIEPGEIVTVVGPNGSGKSTLVRALIGLEPPTEGHVVRKHGLCIGYVPQRLKIEAGLPMTVRRFLSLPRRVTDRAAARALARVGVPGLEQRQLARLSGGQFQRVLLARALLSEPEILILDEPTQGLDQPGVAAFYRLIEDLRRETGVAVLLVSHDLNVVMRASDRVICLNGHICCEGAPEQVSAAPEYRALFGLATDGVLALYRHVHDHDHDGGAHGHAPGETCGHPDHRHPARSPADA
jgi:zinc transport system ATP-binding protein